MTKYDTIFQDKHVLETLSRLRANTPGDDEHADHLLRLMLSYMAKERGGGSIVLPAIYFLFGWLLSFCVFLFRSYTVDPRVLTNRRSIIFSTNTPNQQKTSKKISDFEQGDCLVLPSINCRSFINPGYPLECKLSKPATTSEITDALKRLRSGLSLVLQLAKEYEMTPRDVFKTGYFVSLALPSVYVFAERLKKAISPSKVYYTYPGLGNSIIDLAMQSGGANTFLVLHGSFGGVTYRCMTKNVITPTKYDSWALSNYCYAKNFYFTTEYPKPKVDSYQAQSCQEVLYATNLTADKRQDLAIAANTLVARFMKDRLIPSIQIRPHPRERNPTYIDAFRSLGFRAREYRRAEPGSVVITHLSSVFLEYIFSYRVYIYTGDHPLKDETTIQVAGRYFGFTDHEGLNRLDSLSAEEYLLQLRKYIEHLKSLRCATANFAHLPIW